MTQRFLNPSVAALVLCLAVCFSHIHQGSLSIDSIRYAHIAHEILRTGDWITLYDKFKDTHYANKPPLLFWFVAVSFKLLGFSTFSAKLIGAIFAFAALLLLWRTVRHFYGEKAGFVALLLLVCNRVFGRTIVDLNFEGMVLCGALLCLHASLQVVRDEKLLPRDWFLYGLGLFLLLSSKAPYIAFVLFPFLLALIHSEKFSKIVRLKSFWLGVTLPLLLAVSWFSSVDSMYVNKALQNQITRPLSVPAGYGVNLLQWSKVLFLYYAPFSLIGIYCFFRSRDLKSSEQFFLRMWFLPIVPIILLVDCRVPYLLVPLLALNLIAADYIARNCEFLSLRHLMRACYLIALIVVVGVTSSKFEFHRTNPLLTVFHENTELLKNKTYICLDGDGRVTSMPELKRAEMIVELEFEVVKSAYSSPLLFGAGLQRGDVVVANSICRDNLKRMGTEFLLVKDYGKMVILSLIDVPPEAAHAAEATNDLLEDDPTYH